MRPLHDCPARPAHEISPVARRRCVHTSHPCAPGARVSPKNHPSGRSTCPIRARSPGRTALAPCPGARTLPIRPSSTLSPCSLTDIQRRTRQTPDCRMTTTQPSGRSRECGDAPGACARALLPTASPIALPPRVLPPPVVRRVVIPSRSCAYPVLSIAPVHSGRLNASTALRDIGTSRLTCTHTGIV